MGFQIAKRLWKRCRKKAVQFLKENELHRILRFVVAAAWGHKGRFDSSNNLKIHKEWVRYLLRNIKTKFDPRNRFSKNVEGKLTDGATLWIGIASWIPLSTALTARYGNFAELSIRGKPFEQYSCSSGSIPWLQKIEPLIDRAWWGRNYPLSTREITQVPYAARCTMTFE